MRELKYHSVINVELYSKEKTIFFIRDARPYFNVSNRNHTYKYQFIDGLSLETSGNKIYYGSCDKESSYLDFGCFDKDR